MNFGALRSIFKQTLNQSVGEAPRILAQAEQQAAQAAQAAPKPIMEQVLSLKSDMAQSLFRPVNAADASHNMIKRIQQTPNASQDQLENILVEFAGTHAKTHDVPLKDTLAELQDVANTYLIRTNNPLRLGVKEKDQGALNQLFEAHRSTIENAQLEPLLPKVEKMAMNGYKTATLAELQKFNDIVRHDLLDVAMTPRVNTRLNTMQFDKQREHNLKRLKKRINWELKNETRILQQTLDDFTRQVNDPTVSSKDIMRKLMPVYDTNALSKREIQDQLTLVNYALNNRDMLARNRVFGKYDFNDLNEYKARLMESYKVAKDTPLQEINRNFIIDHRKYNATGGGTTKMPSAIVFDGKVDPTQVGLPGLHIRADEVPIVLETGTFHLPKVRGELYNLLKSEKVPPQLQQAFMRELVDEYDEIIDPAMLRSLGDEVQQILNENFETGLKLGPDGLHFTNPTIAASDDGKAVIKTINGNVKLKLLQIYQELSPKTLALDMQTPNKLFDFDVAKAMIPSLQPNEAHFLNMMFNIMQEDLQIGLKKIMLAKPEAFKYIEQRSLKRAFQSLQNLAKNVPNGNNLFELGKQLDNIPAANKFELQNAYLRAYEDIEAWCGKVLGKFKQIQSQEIDAKYYRNYEEGMVAQDVKDKMHIANPTELEKEQAKKMAKDSDDEQDFTSSLGMRLIEELEEAGTQDFVSYGLRNVHETAEDTMFKMSSQVQRAEPDIPDYRFWKRPSVTAEHKIAKMAMDDVDIADMNLMLEWLLGKSKTDNFGVTTYPDAYNLRNRLNAIKYSDTLTDTDKYNMLFDFVSFLNDVEKRFARLQKTKEQGLVYNQLLDAIRDARITAEINLDNISSDVFNKTRQANLEVERAEGYGYSTTFNELDEMYEEAVFDTASRITNDGASKIGGFYEQISPINGEKTYLKSQHPQYIALHDQMSNMYQSVILGVIRADDAINNIKNFSIKGLMSETGNDAYKRILRGKPLPKNKAQAMDTLNNAGLDLSKQDYMGRSILSNFEQRFKAIKSLEKELGVTSLRQLITPTTNTMDIFHPRLLEQIQKDLMRKHRQTTFYPHYSNVEKYNKTQNRISGKLAKRELGSRVTKENYEQYETLKDKYSNKFARRAKFNTDEAFKITDLEKMYAHDPELGKQGLAFVDQSLNMQGMMEAKLLTAKGRMELVEALIDSKIKPLKLYQPKLNKAPTQEIQETKMVEDDWIAPNSDNLDIDSINDELAIAFQEQRGIDTDSNMLNIGLGKYQSNKKIMKQNAQSIHYASGEDSIDGRSVESLKSEYKGAQTAFRKDMKNFDAEEARLKRKISNTNNLAEKGAMKKQLEQVQKERDTMWNNIYPLEKQTPKEDFVAESVKPQKEAPKGEAGIADVFEGIGSKIARSFTKGGPVKGRLSQMRDELNKILDEYEALHVKEQEALNSNNNQLYFELQDKLMQLRIKFTKLKKEYDDAVSKANSL